MNYASFFRRFAAALVDAAILFIPSLLIGSSAGLPTSFGFGIVIGLLYKPIFESSVLMATPGKALLGIAVTSESGNRITFKAAAIRYLCSYISMAILYIGYLMQPFTSRRQTLHDMIAECIVVRQESPDLNYFAVWRDQLKDVFAKI